MLPGKKYTPEDILKILRKRFWLVVVPWVVIAAATAGIARKLPDLYKSTALIQVVPPQVPESIVRPFTNTRFEDRLNTARQTILSHTRLARLIEEFNLYQEERKSQPMQEVVENMKNDIRVNPQRGEAFIVEYQGSSPITVMNVTQKLADLFMLEGVKEGQLRAEGTNSFVQSAVDEAQKRLKAIEERLSQYKMRHAGELPSQQGFNAQAVSNIQSNLNNVARAIESDLTSKTNLERLIELTEQRTEPPAPPPPPGTDLSKTGTAAQNLEAAKALLNDLLTVKKYKDTHPDVVLARRSVARFTQLANDESLRAPVGSTDAVSPAERQRQAQLATLRDDLELTKKRIENNRAAERKLMADATAYQAKVDNVPNREVELTEILREYQTQTEIYNQYVKNREASSMTLNLELRQFGEQFSLVDPARLPERPFSPDRMYYNLIGLFGGLAVALGLVAFFEYRDSTFKTDYELASVLSLPVLAVVPLMRSDGERRSDFRKRLLLNVGLGSAVALCLAVLTYSFVFIR